MSADRVPPELAKLLGELRRQFNERPQLVATLLEAFDPAGEVGLTSDASWDLVEASFLGAWRFPVGRAILERLAAGMGDADLGGAL